MFYDFNTNYSNFRMVDLQSIKPKMPMTVLDLKLIILDELNINKKFLVENWLRECTEIISLNKQSIESLMPQNNEVSLESVHLEIRCDG